MLSPEIWAENRENSISRYRKNLRESINLFEIEFFFFFGNVWQFISNSNSLNTKYFYDLLISINNSSNTPISNYFLTVRTKEEFTVVRVRELVLVAFSGSPNYSALLHLIQEVGVCDPQVLCYYRQDYVSESWRTGLVAFSGGPNSSALLHLIQEVGVFDLKFRATIGKS